MSRREAHTAWIHPPIGDPASATGLPNWPAMTAMNCGLRIAMSRIADPQMTTEFDPGLLSQKYRRTR